MTSSPPNSAAYTRQSRWIIAPSEELNGGPISWNEICGSECIARLLMRKGFASAEEVENFLQPRLKSLSDPFLLPNMKAAVMRILTALDRQERIVIFGDYDVDGVTSLALLAELFRAYGCAAGVFLPLRLEEGYGLSRESLDRCIEQHRPQLLIAVDCGTASVVEIAHLAQRGVDVIVLDHHEPKSALPDCVAIVNPKISGEADNPFCAAEGESTSNSRRQDCLHHTPSPFEYLCSVGIVFKLCHALLKTRPMDFDLKSKLDLVALGTVADIVPLQGENRIFVQRGAIEIARSARPGLKRLIDVSGVRSPILPEHIGFRLGPRLNASGRLSNAQRSLQLLLTQDEVEAASLADFLDGQNRERQEIEKQVLLAAEEQIGRHFDPARDPAIVVVARGWHPGVLGIVASRIARKYHRPTIVIGVEETGIGKGSGRSIEGLNLVAALQRCSGALQKFGGHDMAAGLTIYEKDVDRFSEAFRQAARELVSDELLQPSLRLDHELAFSELNGDFLRWHEMLQPFGNGNPAPLFFARQVDLVAPPREVREKHLILRLRQGNHHRRAVYFDSAGVSLPPAPWDIAFRIQADEYEGETVLGMQIHAVRQAVANAVSSEQ